MNTHLDGLSGGLFHPTGEEAAAVLGGLAVATCVTAVGNKFIAGELVYDYVTDPASDPALPAHREVR
jgi:hypothetical protein